MGTLNEELLIDKYKALPADGGDPEGRQYRPNRGMRFYPGANLSAERRKALDDQAVDATDLTVDDIVYCLARLVTKTMYEILEQIEERWGKDAAKDVVFEWTRKRGREAIKRWMEVRGHTRLTAELWAEYQDFRHLMSGPIHGHSFVTYTGDTDEDEIVEMCRTGCFFHTGRPDGMDSYSSYVSQGMELGYREAFPEFTLRVVECMSEGTSEKGCTLRFRIKKDGSQDPPAAPEHVSSSPETHGLYKG